MMPLVSLAGVVLGPLVLALGAVVCWRSLWNVPNPRRAWGGGMVGFGGLALLVGSYMSMYGLPGWLTWGSGVAIVAATPGAYLIGRSGPPLALEGVQLAAHRRRVTARTGPLGAGALLVSVLAMPAIALFGGVEGDAQHVFVDSLPSENNGAYLVTKRGAMQLYDWHAQPPEFPRDAPTLVAGELLQMAVVQKQFDELEKYPLVNLTTGERVQWLRSDRKGTQLLLDPVLPLKPGEYRFVRSTDSPYGGSTIHYFTLR